MKTLEEYKQYFQASMLPRLEELETARLRVMRRYLQHMGWVVGVWAVGFGFAISLGLRGEALGRGILPLHALSVFALFSVFMWRTLSFIKGMEPIRLRCKQEVIVPMLHWLVPELQYEPEGNVNLELAKRSDVIGPFEKVDGKDCFRGQVGATQLEFGELRTTWTHIVKDSKGEHKEERHNHGLFLVATGPRNFSGATLIVPDDKEAALGDLGARMLTAKKLAFTSSELPGTQAGGAEQVPNRVHFIHMEDPAFEDAFMVYCTDDVQTHALLTPVMMQRLTTYFTNAKRSLRLHFEGHHMLAYFQEAGARIVREGSTFDVTGDQDLREFGQFLRFYEDVGLALGIVDALHLNERAWGGLAAPRVS